MTWGKIDDNLAFHPKVAMAGNEAMGLWVRALSYSCQQLTDGFVPAVIVQSLGGVDVANRLVEVGLWLPVENGYQFNDWAEYQLSGADLKDRRSKLSLARSEAGKRGAEKRWDGKSDSNPMATVWQDDGKADGKNMANAMASGWQEDSPVPVPVPVPVPEIKTPTRSARGSRIPEPFTITQPMVEWARANTPGISVGGVTAEFVDYWRGVAGSRGVKLDWEATWRNWLRRKAGDARPATRDDANMAVIASLQARRDSKELTQ